MFFRKSKPLTEVSKMFLKRFLPVRKRHIDVASFLYEEFGEPAKVLKKINYKIDLDKIGPKEVVVNILASPVNPVDVNIIQGKYSVESTLPAVPGFEGVGEIAAVGAEVRNFSVGDRAIPLKFKQGLWRTHAIFEEKDLYKVPKDLDIVQAATLTVNPCTAYRVLKDFGNLKPGDVVIQNGGNSAVGQSVIQIARNWGIKTVNVVRDRPNISELKDYLLGLGATEVLTEEELRKSAIFKSNTLSKPKLALNCIGGKSATEITRHLQNGSYMVTYGGMSLEPVVIPTSLLIFKDIKYVGFSIGTWTSQNFDSQERYQMFDEIIQMMVNGKHKEPVHRLINFNDCELAFNKTLSAGGMVGEKFILTF